ncbi:isochorismatase family protein [Desulfopila inferna]|uniref:isochorismatase family protein n=1 Tax=Desulfopila inferna TaxID=468528 RepID=UPI0019635701|nr:isochorismatase family protein [Desulfopila inferna]MBM9605111.1 isochorismatase family protein [Desulfopila inferna]
MSTYTLVKPTECCLHIIDPQKSLMSQITEAQRVSRVIGLLIQCAEILKIRTLANTQYIKGLGPYVDDLEKLVTNIPRRDKVEFSAYRNKETMQLFDSLSEGISTVIMVGVETHICIYQSAMGVLARGLTPWIVADGVSSRNLADHELGLARLRQAGAVVGPAEMIIYELLGKAGTAEFKEMLPYIIAFIKAGQ